MDRIKVGVKLRPLINREKAERSQNLWRTGQENTICQVEPTTGKVVGEPHHFDFVFGPESSNQDVFEELVKPIVEASVKGFNGTIFAYGQTASGKTYTMMGDQYEQGIIPQAVNFIFSTIENTPGREFLLSVCFMEIYNERVNDLLNKANKNLKISVDQGNVIVIKKDTEVSIDSASMVMNLIKEGERIQQIGKTNMKERSSRSHTIFRVIIKSRSVGSDTDEAFQVSHLNLVDLAGSQRAGATGSVEDQLKEGCYINKSLFTLGKVISEVNGNYTFVHFRDSKLTRILQSSLGGNALTSIICTITPAALRETTSTLDFASRARNIKNKAQVNEVLSEAALLKRYVKQMQTLKSQVNSLQEGKNAENLQLQNQNILLQERINRLEDALLVSHADSPDKSKKLKKLRRKTWSAPHSNVSRLSLAPLTTSTGACSCFEDIRRDKSGRDFLPLEDNGNLNENSEFEKNLIKAEGAKSLGDNGLMPTVELLEDTVDADNYPPISNVHTRTKKKTLSKQEDSESLVETPPSQLRAKILCVEKELDEISEFTRLEKQTYNEEVIAELEKVKKDLAESTAQCESLKNVKEEMEKLRSINPTAYDSQVLLMDYSRQNSQLKDEIKEINKDLSVALKRCSELERLKNEHDVATKQLSEAKRENVAMKDLMEKQRELVQQLQNQKEDLDAKLEIVVSKHEARERDLVRALQDARYELSLLQRPSQLNQTRVLYSVEEEPTIDYLAEQVQDLKEQNNSLQNLHSQKIEKIKVLELDIMKKNKLLESLQISIQDNNISTETSVDSLVNEVPKLKALVEEKTRELEEYKKISAQKIEELHANIVDIKKGHEDLASVMAQNEGYQTEMDVSLNSDGVEKSLYNSASKNILLRELAMKQERILELEKELSNKKSTIKSDPSPLTIEEKPCNIIEDKWERENYVSEYTQSNGSYDQECRKCVESKEEMESIWSILKTEVKDIEISEVVLSVAIMRILSSLKCAGEKCVELEEAILSAKHQNDVNLVALKEDFDKEILNYQTELLALNHTKSTLTKELESKEAIIAEAQEEIAALNEKLKEMTDFQQMNDIQALEVAENVSVLNSACPKCAEYKKEVDLACSMICAEVTNFTCAQRKSLTSLLSETLSLLKCSKVIHSEPTDIVQATNSSDQSTTAEQSCNQIEAESFVETEEVFELAMESKQEVDLNSSEKSQEMTQELIKDPECLSANDSENCEMNPICENCLQNQERSSQIQKECQTEIESLTKQVSDLLGDVECYKVYQTKVDSLNNINSTLLTQLESKDSVIAEANKALEVLKSEVEEIFSSHSIPTSNCTEWSKNDSQINPIYQKCTGILKWLCEEVDRYKVECESLKKSISTLECQINAQDVSGKEVHALKEESIEFSGSEQENGSPDVHHANLSCTKCVESEELLDSIWSMVCAEVNNVQEKKGKSVLIAIRQVLASTKNLKREIEDSKRILEKQLVDYSTNNEQSDFSLPSLINEVLQWVYKAEKELESVTLSEIDTLDSKLQANKEIIEQLEEELRKRKTTD